MRSVQICISPIVPVFDLGRLSLNFQPHFTSIILSALEGLQSGCGRTTLLLYKDISADAQSVQRLHRFCLIKGHLSNITPVLVRKLGGSTFFMFIFTSVAVLAPPRIF